MQHTDYQIVSKKDSDNVGYFAHSGADPSDSTSYFPYLLERSNFRRASR